MTSLERVRTDRDPAIFGEWGPGYNQILTPGALDFILTLEDRFGARRRGLLEQRRIRQTEFDGGALPDFRSDTAAIRDGDWTISETPDDLKDRRVEITGPVDRKMMINAFNSGARVFMADFEDATAPTWDNLLQGQINLRDYVTGALEFTDPESGKHYAVSDSPAVLIVRPRGWHMQEAHVEFKGMPISASLFDFGLHFYHNARALIQGGSGPYFYLPKLESYEEACLWDDVFRAAQDLRGLPVGTIKATVLIETLPAAFEMDEILYGLRQHVVGLNCGRWDYIFSFIKRLRNHSDKVLPDRSQVDMGRAFLRAYSLALIKTCHRRGAHAMGGMAAQIPVKNDREANASAFAKVRADKEREATDGHDGTWVAHPGLVPVAMEVFDRCIDGPNQIDNRRDDVAVRAKDLLEVHDGTRTEEGLRENIRVGVQYIEAWLGGRGAVPLYNLMEDAATAEISRTQIWQWLAHGAELEGGGAVDRALVRACFDDEIESLRHERRNAGISTNDLDDAAELFWESATSEHLEEFLTGPAYERLISQSRT